MRHLLNTPVGDSGKGIPSGLIDRLFSKFVTKSDTGTGLGLFISKSIIEAHGGMIWAENNVGNVRSSLPDESIDTGL